MQVVKLARLCELRSHERVVWSRVYSLAESFLREHVVYKPIIVEEKSYTVIDGHHRLSALKLIGAKLAPVVEARYGVDVYRVGSWSLTIRARDPWRVLEELEATGSGAEATVEFNGCRFRVRVDPVEVQFKARSLGSNGRCRVLVKLPELGVSDVVRAGCSGDLFPPRTTLHETPLKKLVCPVKTRLLL